MVDKRGPPLVERRIEIAIVCVVYTMETWWSINGSPPEASDELKLQLCVRFLCYGNVVVDKQGHPGASDELKSQLCAFACPSTFPRRMAPVVAHTRDSEAHPMQTWLRHQADNGRMIHTSMRVRKCCMCGSMSESCDGLILDWCRHPCHPAG